MDFPFCIAWANEPWTRSWDGNNDQVLIAQEYGDKEDWENHFEYLIKLFLDSRYIKIDEKPVFLIYRPANIDCCDEMLKLWDRLAKGRGLKGIYFVQMLTSFNNNIESDKFGAKMEFEPLYTLKQVLRLKQKPLAMKSEIGEKEPKPKVNKLDYDIVWNKIRKRKLLNKADDCITFPGAFVDWDNTARKGRNGLVLTGGSPDKFKKYLSSQIKKAKSNNAEFLFVNAWNEWAEGAYLEPDKRYAYRSNVSSYLACKILTILPLQDYREYEEVISRR